MATVFTRFIPSRNPFTEFWQQHPALLYGLTCLMGCLYALVSQKGPLIIPLAIILATAYSRLLPSLFLGLGAFLYCWASYLIPIMPPEGIEGKALLSIQSLSDSQSTFGPAWHIEGRLKAFIPNAETDSVARGIRYRLVLAANPDRIRPDASTDYWVEARLRQAPQGTFRLNADKDADWWPVENSWSFAEMRYQAKQHFSQYIHQHVTHERSANLLIGLLTGEFSDKQTRLSLGRFGLQHILAISGFHFALLAGILTLILGSFFSLRWTAVVLLIALTFYFAFLGYGPSISRAYIAIAIVLLGQLLARPCHALNNLGVSMMIVLAYEPDACLSPAFQLSFLATGAILLLHQPVQQALNQLWRKRPLSELVGLSAIDQHGYVVLAIARQALALTIAVHLLTVPVSLYYFQKFPLLSLVFNVFFPFLISISIMLLLAASAVYVVLPWLASPLFTLNTVYTKSILNLTFNTPTRWDIILRTEVPSLWTLSLFLCSVIVLGIFLRDATLEDSHWSYL